MRFEGLVADVAGQFLAKFNPDRDRCWIVERDGLNVGSVLVAVKLPEGRPFAVALTMMIVFTVIGLILGVLLPRQSGEAGRPAESSTAAAGETTR